ncbi:TOBE domain-containing protein [Nocardia neocaledoniensis]|uniref:TOBE domain-containing protein n=1 Tax=Nocardia neocaledoniensis TaxID=236511 RepID=UPI001FC97E4C|nr:TOBE domain-containing protein [Nocardia neocaledoniensis]
MNATTQTAGPSAAERGERATRSPGHSPADTGDAVDQPISAKPCEHSGPPPGHDPGYSEVAGQQPSAPAQDEHSAQQPENAYSELAGEQPSVPSQEEYSAQQPENACSEESGEQPSVPGRGEYSGQSIGRGPAHADGVADHPHRAAASAFGTVDAARLRVDGRTVGEFRPGDSAAAVFAPASVAVFTSPPDGSPRNVFAGRIADIADHGGIVRVRGELGAAGALHADLTPAAVAQLDLTVGTTVYFVVKATEVRVYAC